MLCFHPLDCSMRSFAGKTVCFYVKFRGVKKAHCKNYSRSLFIKENLILFVFTLVTFLICSRFPDFHLVLLAQFHICFSAVQSLKSIECYLIPIAK